MNLRALCLAGLSILAHGHWIIWCTAVVAKLHDACILCMQHLGITALLSMNGLLAKAKIGKYSILDPHRMRVRIIVDTDESLTEL